MHLDWVSERRFEWETAWKERAFSEHLGWESLKASLLLCEVPGSLEVDVLSE